MLLALYVKYSHEDEKLRHVHLFGSNAVGRELHGSTAHQTNMPGKLHKVHGNDRPRDGIG